MPWSSSLCHCLFLYNFCNNIWYVWYAFWHKIYYCVTGSFAFIFKSNVCLLAPWQAFMLLFMAQKRFVRVNFKSLCPARNSPSSRFFFLFVYSWGLIKIYIYLIYCQDIYHFGSIWSLALLISLYNVLLCNLPYPLYLLQDENIIGLYL